MSNLRPKYISFISSNINLPMTDSKKDIISGKEVFSILMPPDFNFIGKSKPGETVIIKNGKLIEGVIDSANIGGGKGLMLRNIHKKYGEAEAIKIIEAIFRLGTAVLIKRGFTIGISDADLPQEAINKINNTLAKAREDVKVLTQGYHDGTLQAFPGRTLKETLELKILELLNKARNETGEIVSDYSNKETHMMIMADSGARGNLLNLAQMAACVGQQAMRGKRIEKGYNERTLSCFKKGDLGPEAHGFIADGFKKGLNPREFFFASMTGRDSLMDTALRTPKSGYLYRRLANALQDLKIEYDNTVRDSSRKIIQFDYGEDRIDVSKSDGGILNVKNIIKSVIE